VPAGDPPLARADGFIETDDHFQTSIPGIYAVGDVNGRFDQAHAASAQGLHVVDHIKGSDAPFPAGRVPRNIYTHPEVAQVGPGEPELRARGIDYRIGGFSLAANGKALAAGESEGFIRVLAERKHGEVLGVQILAAQATDLIAEAGLLLEMEGTAEDLARTIHAHPTVSEIFGEAGLDAFASALHK
jgi:dihydrolipoamide dehydrogenase